MNKSSKVLTIVVILAIIFVPFLPSLFSSIFSSFTEDQLIEDTGYVITSYDANVVYHKDNTVVVTEIIKANLTTPSRGIYRAVPEVSNMTYEQDGKAVTTKNMRLEYTNISCNTNIQTESVNNYLYMYLGNIDSYIIGPHSYTLNYTIKRDARFADYDIFYYNVLGNLWDTKIESFSATITFEEDVDQSQTFVYFGKYGSSETITPVWNNSKSYSVFASNIPFGTGITVKSTMPENYATASKITTIDYVMLIGILFVVFVNLLSYFKKSNKKQITPVVQFKPADKYTSADVGYIIDKKVNTEDIASLIIYWADKGHLKIYEEDKNTFLEATDKSLEDMKNYEKTMFGKIFEGKNGKSSRINIKDIGDQIKDSIVDVKKKIATENDKLFNTSATSLRSFCILFTSAILMMTLIFVNYQNVQDSFVFVSIVAGILNAVVMFMFAGYVDKKHTATKKDKNLVLIITGIYLIGLLVLCILSFDAYCDPFFTVFLAFAMVCVEMFLLNKFNIRTDEGCQELGDIIGLKNFIETAEVSRLKMLAEQDPHLYYSVMPYAYVFGLYDKWCKKFETIVVEPPDYYYSNGDFVFDFIVFNHIISLTNASILNSINVANMANIAKGVGSATSTFSGGGGFSGGGFGGGGGGRW